MNDTVKQAKRFATTAHDGQFRRDGITPYINHPKAVAAKLGGESEEIVAAAWLHDVIEDTGFSAHDLHDAGFSLEVQGMVIRLTHWPEQDYESYIRHIKENPKTVKIKVADILHNLSDNPTDKQILKYAKALQILLTK